jgi:hypothetical protein
MIKNNNNLDSLSKSLLNDVRSVLEGKSKACKCDNNCSCGKEEKDEDEEKDEKKEVKEAKKMKGEDPCWKDYKMVGTKKGKGGKEVPNCVPEETEIKEGEEKGGGYNATAVNKAISSSRQKIGGREAKKIHALLKGSSGYKSKDAPVKEEAEINEEVDFAKVRKQFDRNEDRNAHSVNAVLIAKHAGTEEHHKEAKDILKQHNKLGHLSGDLSKRRQALYKQLEKTDNYKKIFPEHKVNEEVELEEGEEKGGGYNAPSAKGAMAYKKVLGQHTVHKGGVFHRSFPSEGDAMNYIQKNQPKKTYSKVTAHPFHGMSEEVNEAKAESPIKGTRLISKHEGKDGHHAEVRFSPDWNEYSVHHYENGKHMGEGPVSYHGEGKEGREDATSTAEHEVKNYRPKGGSLRQVKEEEDKQAQDASNKRGFRERLADKYGLGDAYRDYAKRKKDNLQKEEVQIDEISHKTRSSWLSKTFKNHFDHRVDDSTTASGWRIDPPLKGPMSDSRLKIYKIASDKAQKQNTKDYEDRKRKKREQYTPKVHDLRHMDHDEVYDHTQTSNKIKDGDVMRVKNGTAAMIGAWPTMIHGKSDVLHSFKDGTSIKTIDDGTYHKTSKLADVTHGIKEEVKLDEKLIGKQHKIDKNKNGRLDKQDFKMLRKEEAIEEKLDPSMGAGKYVTDFVKSKNPRFEGKTKAERIKMALGAYYGAKNEAVEIEEAKHGEKRDYAKHHIEVDGKYIATTTWARDAKEAEKRFLQARPEYKGAKITISKDQ